MVQVIRLEFTDCLQLGVSSIGLYFRSRLGVVSFAGLLSPPLH